MGVRIYEVEQWPMVDETYATSYSQLETKIALGRWHRDDIMVMKMPGSEQDRIIDTVEAATEGREWDLGFCEQDLSSVIKQPLVYEMYIEYLEAQASDFPSCQPLWFVMTDRMRDAILSTGIRAAVYPVAVLERELLKGVPEDQVLTGFNREANVRYSMVQLLEPLDLFDQERSDRMTDEWYLSAAPTALPPFFRVVWGPRSALLATDEGKQRLEQAKLLGVRFTELNMSGPGSSRQTPAHAVS